MLQPLGNDLDIFERLGAELKQADGGAWLSIQIAVKFPRGSFRQVLAVNLKTSVEQ